VPINRKHPIAELLAACWHYVEKQNARNVTFEYVMLDGVNDLPEHARELVGLLRGRPAKVNLIPFNPFPQHAVPPLERMAIERFRDILLKGGVMATIRRTRGDDIDAAVASWWVGSTTVSPVVSARSRFRSRWVQA
jgi:23S rRNA (adenine2503-C2)-methyltransferase